MYHAMANGVNIADTLNLVHSQLFRDRPTKNHLHGCTRVSDRLGKSLWRFAFSSKRHDAGPADTLNQSVRQTLVRVLLYSLEVSSDQLKLDRRAPAVKDKYVHDFALPLKLGKRSVPPAIAGGCAAMWRLLNHLIRST